MPENGRGRVEFVHRSWPADPAQLSVIRRELGGWLAPLALTGSILVGDGEARTVVVVDRAGGGVNVITVEP